MRLSFIILAIALGHSTFALGPTGEHRALLDRRTRSPRRGISFGKRQEAQPSVNEPVAAPSPSPEVSPAAAQSPPASEPSRIPKITPEDSNNAASPPPAESPSPSPSPPAAETPSPPPPPAQNEQQNGNNQNGQANGNGQNQSGQDQTEREGNGDQTQRQGEGDQTEREGNGDQTEREGNNDQQQQQGGNSQQAQQANTPAPASTPAPVEQSAASSSPSLSPSPTPTPSPSPAASPSSSNDPVVTVTDNDTAREDTLTKSSTQTQAPAIQPVAPPPSESSSSSSPPPPPAASSTEREQQQETSSPASSTTSTTTATPERSSNLIESLIDSLTATPAITPVSIPPVVIETSSSSSSSSSRGILDNTILVPVIPEITLTTSTEAPSSSAQPTPAPEVSSSSSTSRSIDTDPLLLGSISVPGLTFGNNEPTSSSPAAAPSSTDTDPLLLGGITVPGLTPSSSRASDSQPPLVGIPTLTVESPAPSASQPSQEASNSGGLVDSITSVIGIPILSIPGDNNATVPSPTGVAIVPGIISTIISEASISVPAVPTPSISGPSVSIDLTAVRPTDVTVRNETIDGQQSGPVSASASGNTVLSDLSSIESVFGYVQTGSLIVGPSTTSVPPPIATIDGSDILPSLSSTPSASPIPSSWPAKIVPPVAVSSSTPSGFSLASILFSGSLSYNWLLENPASASQVFVFMPTLLANALNVSTSDIQSVAIVPYQPDDYTTTSLMPAVWMGYLPTDVMGSLQSQILSPNSPLYTASSGPIAQLAMQLDASLPVDAFGQPGSGPNANLATISSDDADNNRKTVLIAVVASFAAAVLALGAFVVLRARRLRRQAGSMSASPGPVHLPEDEMRERERPHSAASSIESYRSDESASTAPTRVLSGYEFDWAGLERDPALRRSSSGVRRMRSGRVAVISRPQLQGNSLMM